MSCDQSSEKTAEFPSGTATGWSALPTEARHPASMALDTLPAEDVVSLLLEEDRRGLDAALRQRDAVAKAALWAAESLAAEGSVLFAGAGTSGRLGVLEAAECPPTFGTDPQSTRAVIAGGRDAVFAAREGAEDREEDGRAVASELDEGDLLIGISASSVTPFAQGALAKARERGARTVLLTCASGAGLESVADLVIALETGPEILTGSTRLKAGSATKAVLNAITTAAMVRLGKVYQNLMVDLRPGSAKLVDRAKRIVQAATELPRDRVEELLEAAGGEVKTAIVIGKLGCSVEAARDRLEKADGQIRAALTTER